ncbi:MarR family transcriptional regulator [Cryobacterium algoricola]|uniref:MarR family transcriptional regulator n=1 Tax=Cryobacterium algoricola TaxID=1259183 RepID=A0ABY2ICT7_9MICO|nr:MarR family winged helix-turn-helix transcriptional regulator [Cryobacterium algoricola]TFB85272.1 MarR family transcriptional regulator [Cryobacterium algoricola]
MDFQLKDIGLAVKRLQVRHHRTADAVLAPLGMTLVQWDALRHLSQNPEASLHDLAVLTFQTDQAFGSLAGRMIDRGLIERVAGPGRATRHRLTPLGEALRVQAGELVEGVLRESFSPLSETELETFGTLLMRIMSAEPSSKGGASLIR